MTIVEPFKICPVCNKVFRRSIFASNQIYCSNECCCIANRERKKERKLNDFMSKAI